MKNNFTKQAPQYSIFRPDYPDEMIDYILSFVKNRKEMLDVATGSGQAAVKFAPFFTKVYATDISPRQIEFAAKKDNIIYSLESAEQTSFADHRLSLITVAQAIHWFDFEKFYKEVQRLLTPDGILAVMGYGLFSTNPETDKIIRHFYTDIIGNYWDAERKYIDDNYKTIPFPFDEMPSKPFTNTFIWNFEQLEGYLDTWSATQHYKDETGNNPIEIIKQNLRESWEKGDKRVVFPMLLRIGKRKKL